MSYATSDKRIEALKSERRQLISAKQALEKRIDELCAEVERLHAEQAHWELGNCPSCHNVADLQEALERNAKLFEAATKWMAKAAHFEAESTKLRELARGLAWCSHDRYLSHPESECPLYDENVEGKCRAEELKRELGVDA